MVPSGRFDDGFVAKGVVPRTIRGRRRAVASRVRRGRRRLSADQCFHDLRHPGELVSLPPYGGGHGPRWINGHSGVHPLSQGSESELLEGVCFASALPWSRHDDRGSPASTQRRGSPVRFAFSVAAVAVRKSKGGQLRPAQGGTQSRQARIVCRIGRSGDRYRCFRRSQRGPLAAAGRLAPGSSGRPISSGRAGRVRARVPCR